MRRARDSPVARITFKETLNKSSMSRVAGKIAMIARRATKVVAGTTMPRSATMRAQVCRNPHGHKFCGRAAGLRSWRRGSTVRRVARLASRPQNRVRGHAGLIQCFLNAACAYACRNRGPLRLDAQHHGRLAELADALVLETSVLDVRVRIPCLPPDQYGTWRSCHLSRGETLQPRNPVTTWKFESPVPTGHAAVARRIRASPGVFEFRPAGHKIQYPRGANWISAEPYEGSG
jgi:hypothetical protein